jgi:hypothetical protein
VISIAQDLRKLLFDKESPEVAQLPRTRNSQDRQLQQRPSDHPTIHTLANIPKLGLTLALEDLLALDILQARVQVAHLFDHILNLILVRTLDFRSVADGHVELELDAADGRTGEQEATGRGYVGGREAQAVVASVGGGEDEFAAGLGTLGDDAVVVVEDFVDGYEDALSGLVLGGVWRVVGWRVKVYHVGVRHVSLRLLVPLCGCEVAWIIMLKRCSSSCTALGVC